jgi:hypothetical protein
MQSRVIDDSHFQVWLHFFRSTICIATLISRVGLSSLATFAKMLREALNAGLEIHLRLMALLNSLSLIERAWEICGLFLVSAIITLAYVLTKIVSWIRYRVMLAIIMCSAFYNLRLRHLEIVNQLLV